MNQFPPLSPEVLADAMSDRAATGRHPMRRPQQPREWTRKFEAAVFWIIFAACIFGALLVIPS